MISSAAKASDGRFGAGYVHNPGTFRAAPAASPATRPLRWEFAADPIGKALLGVYRKLIGIRNRYASLHSDNFYSGRWEQWKTQVDPQGYGIDVSKQVMIYHR